jgi:hypothetical protein
MRNEFILVILMIVVFAVCFGLRFLAVWVEYIRVENILNEENEEEILHNGH